MKPNAVKKVRLNNGRYYIIIIKYIKNNFSNFIDEMRGEEKEREREREKESERERDRERQRVTETEKWKDLLDEEFTDEFILANNNGPPWIYGTTGVRRLLVRSQQLFLWFHHLYFYLFCV